MILYTFILFTRVHIPYNFCVTHGNPEKKIAFVIRVYKLISALKTISNNDEICNISFQKTLLKHYKNLFM